MKALIAAGIWLAAVLLLLPAIVPADPTGIARLRYTEHSR